MADLRYLLGLFLDGDGELEDNPFDGNVQLLLPPTRLSADIFPRYSRSSIYTPHPWTTRLRSDHGEILMGQPEIGNKPNSKGGSERYQPYHTVLVACLAVGRVLVW